MKNCPVSKLLLLAVLSLFCFSCETTELTTTDTYNGHEYVDLGLPSGLMWATCNVGAKSPTDYGDYFAWGEIKTKSEYTWGNYIYGDKAEIKKYSREDKLTNLLYADDVAHCSWGENWRMPTEEDINELIAYCDIERRTINDVNGYIVVSKQNNNSIFLPAVGYRDVDGSETSIGNEAFYWSSSFSTSQSEKSLEAVALCFQRHEFENHSIERNLGCAVRPVCSLQNRLLDPWVVSGSHNGHDYVDLGLPSGLKWAICNIGAASPVFKGDYFAWGEIEPKSEYDWSTYKYGYSTKSLRKYNTDSDRGVVDSLTVLLPEDDAAHMNLGGEWRMPTDVEAAELFENCTYVWTSVFDVKGAVLEGPNGNCIFFPIGGMRSGDGYSDKDTKGYYWTSSLTGYSTDGADNLSFDEEKGRLSAAYSRICGMLVRGVYGVGLTNSYIVTVESNDDSMGSVTGGGSYSEGAQITLTATPNPGYEFVRWDDGNTDNPRTVTVTSSVSYTAIFQPENVASGSHNGHDYVDLGLPSGLLWATCNVGATNPEDYGNYYAWGEIETKEMYDWNTYKHGVEFDLRKYNTDSDYGIVDNKTTLELEDDAAYINWGGVWRMPTSWEYKELINNCTTEWISVNGVYGRKVISNINSNYIFFPAAGIRSEDILVDDGRGYYWSSSYSPSWKNCAWYLVFHMSDFYGFYDLSRCVGLSVRAVCPADSK